MKQKHVVDGSVDENTFYENGHTFSLAATRGEIADRKRWTSTETVRFGNAGSRSSLPEGFTSESTGVVSIPIKASTGMSQFSV